MRTIIIIFVIIGSLRPGPLVATGHVSGVRNVSIHVTGIMGPNGSLRATLDATPEAFKNDAVPMRILEQAVAGHDAVLTFTGVPAGLYAIKIIHDENNNGVLDLNILGIPKERYGISNNVRSRVGLPSFSDARFEIKQSNIELNIELKEHRLF